MEWRIRAFPSGLNLLPGLESNLKWSFYGLGPARNSLVYALRVYERQKAWKGKIDLYRKALNHPVSDTVATMAKVC